MSVVISFDEIDEHNSRTYRGTFTFTPAEIDSDAVASVGPAEIEVRAEKGEQPVEYVVDGTVKFMSDFNCSRCLEPYPIASASNIHVRFRPRGEASEEDEEIEINDAEELDVEFYSQREIFLRDLAFEQVELSIPMKPLCDEKCLGLCSHCGANRNREQCSCESSVVDERWSSLKEFRDQLSKKRDV